MRRVWPLLLLACVADSSPKVETTGEPTEGSPCTSRADCVQPWLYCKTVENLLCEPEITGPCEGVCFDGFDPLQCPDDAPYCASVWHDCRPEETCHPCCP